MCWQIRGGLVASTQKFERLVECDSCHEKPLFHKKCPFYVNTEQSDKTSEKAGNQMKCGIIASHWPVRGFAEFCWACEMARNAFQGRRRRLRPLGHSSIFNLADSEPAAQSPFCRSRSPTAPFP